MLTNTPNAIKHHEECLCDLCTSSSTNTTNSDNDVSIKYNSVNTKYRDFKQVHKMYEDRRVSFRRSRSGYRSRSRHGNISELPPINNTPIQVRCMRYQGSITSYTEFRVGDITTMLLGVTNSSSTAIVLMEAVRLQRLVVTLLPNSTTNAGTFALSWDGEREPHLTQTMFYTMGTPARWSFTPPEGSLATFWFNQDTSETTSTVFRLDPDNSTVEVILDIHFEYVLADGSTDTLTLGSAATFSGVAARVMPGGATDELYPVGLNYVTS